MVPSGLYARLCHAFLVFFYFKPNYLRIYWTEFHDFFYQMKDICVSVIDLDLKGCCHGNRFGKICEMTYIKRPAFRNKLEFCNSNLQVLYSNILSTFYASFIVIGSLTEIILICMEFL